MEIYKNLPEELIVKILSFLSNADLKNCILISRYFRELILTSPFLMRKIRITICSLNASAYNDMIKFLKLYGLHVKILHFTRSFFHHEDEFIEIIKLVPNIESLICHEIKIGKDNIEALMKYDINFKNLIDADFNCTHSNLHPFFMKCVEKSPKLKFLSIRYSCGLNGGFRMEDVDILMQKDKLEVLLTSDIEFSDKNLDLSIFKSCKLKLNYILFVKSTRFSESFYQFIKTQADHAKILKMTFEDDLRLLDMVVKDFKYIEEIVIRINPEIIDKISRDLLHCQMMNVKHLQVIAVNQISEAELMTVLNLFPNIEILLIRDFNRKYQYYRYNEILPNFKNLSMITFTRIKPSSLEEIMLPNLKCLKITDTKFFREVLKHENFWKNFFTNCPNIEKIIFKTNYTFPPEAIPDESKVFAVLESIIKHLNILSNLKYIMYEHEVNFYNIIVDAKGKIIEHYIGSEDIDFKNLYPNFETFYIEEFYPFTKYRNFRRINWDQIYTADL